MSEVVEPSATYRFLASVRSGMPSLFQAVDDLGKGAAAPAVAKFDLAVPLTGADYKDPGQPAADTVAKASVITQGPGDVVGVNPRQVIRVFPKDRTTDAETSMFPLVEFNRPDLPWMFTPVKATPDGRLRPWLCLVVVKKQEGVTYGPRPDKPLPLLQISAPAAPSKELPDPADAWLWAHAQVVGAAGGVIGDVLKHQSSLTLSRLICPRRMEADTPYLACVVPTFKVGVKVGSGDKITDADEAALTPAWGPADTSVSLPVYYSFEFSTGAFGDFASLAEQLVPRAAPPTLGHRDMDLTRPGNGLPEIDPVDPATPGAIFPLQGALAAAGYVAPVWPASASGPFADRLTAELNAPHDLANPAPGAAAGGELTVGPPIYGQWHAAHDTIDATAPLWLRQLNLDPGNRVAAGLGATVVEADAEDLMAAAWSQIGDVDRANAALRRAQFGREVLQKIYDRHVAPLILNDAPHATAAVHRRVIDASGVTVSATIGASALPRSAATTAMRRMVRSQGPVGRAWQATPLKSARSVTDRMAQASLVASPAPGAPDGTVTLADPVRFLGAQLAASVATKMGSATADAAGLSAVISKHNAILTAAPALAVQARAVTQAAIAPKFDLATSAATVAAHDFLARSSIFVTQDAVSRQVLVMRAASPVAVAAAPVAAAPVALAPVAGLHVAALPAAAVGAAAAGNRVDVHDKLRVPPVVISDSADAVTVRALASQFADRVLLATDAPLAAVAQPLASGVVQTALLTGLHPETTVFNRTSAALNIDLHLRPGFGPPNLDVLAPIMAAPVFPRPMYEALRDYAQDFLVPGLDLIPPNTITLLQTNPVFVESFLVGLNHEMGRKLLWRGYPTDQRGTYFHRFWGQTDDIVVIPGFNPALGIGKHVAGGDTPQLVLLVRGDLLRRYPSAIIYAVPATGTTKAPVFDDSRIKLPIFRGSLEPDFTFIGFDIVAEEAWNGVKDPTPPAATEDWWFVIAEHPTEPRFGLHEPAWGAVPPPLVTWDDVSWSHVAKTEAEFNAMSYAPTAASFAPLLGKSITVNGTPVAYGAQGGAQAHVCFRNPVRVAMHAHDVLPPPVPHA